MYRVGKQLGEHFKLRRDASPLERRKYSDHEEARMSLNYE